MCLSKEWVWVSCLCLTYLSSENHSTLICILSRQLPQERPQQGGGMRLQRQPRASPVLKVVDGSLVHKAVIGSQYVLAVQWRRDERACISSP